MLVEFNFFSSFIVFIIILLPLFLLMLTKSTRQVIFQINLAYNKIITLLIIGIILLILSSVISITQNSLHILNIIIISFILNLLLIIKLSKAISLSTKTKIYLFSIISIIITYTLVISSINSFYPYYNDDVRDILTASKIIENGSLTEAVNLLQRTERYYSVLPMFQLLITILTYISTDIKITYLIIGIIQLLGITLGTFILLSAINKYLMNKIKEDNNLSYRVPFIGSLLIIGLPFGFFNIIATQPQSIGILLSILIIYIFVRYINKSVDKYSIISFGTLILAANIYHAITAIILLIFIFYYLLDFLQKRHNRENLSGISIQILSSIVILSSILIIVYWYDQNTILRIQRQYELTINTLQTVNVNTTTTSIQENLSKGFKFYAYSYAFIISAIICILIMIFLKTNATRIHGIYKPFLIFAILLLLLIMSSFVSTVIAPAEGLGRYLLGQGIIFILSLIIVSSIIGVILTHTYNKKYILMILVMLFIYNISGLTQPYWNPDTTFNTYSTDINYENVKAIYSKITENDIVYLTHNIPVRYDLHYTDNYLIKLYKLRTDYQSLSKRFIEGEPIFYKATLPSQSVINFLPNERVSFVIENSNKFNKVFMSNRYSAFYTTLFMTVR